MSNHKISIDVFNEIFNYFADAMIETGNKLIFVTIFPCSLNYIDGKNSEKKKAFNEIIRKNMRKWIKLNVY